MDNFTQSALLSLQVSACGRVLTWSTLCTVGCFQDRMGAIFTEQLLQDGLFATCCDVGGIKSRTRHGTAYHQSSRIEVVWQRKQEIVDTSGCATGSILFTCLRNGAHRRHGMSRALKQFSSETDLLQGAFFQPGAAFRLCSCHVLKSVAFYILTNSPPAVVFGSQTSSRPWLHLPRCCRLSQHGWTESEPQQRGATGRASHIGP